MVTDKRWEQIRDGVIGHFETRSDSGLPELQGMLKLSNEGAALVLAMTHSQFDDDHLPPSCSAITGQTEVGGVLMLAINQRSGTLGGYPTGRYRSQSLILDADPDEVQEDTVGGVRLGYEGLRAWSGLRNIDDEPVLDGDGAVVGWKVELRKLEPVVVELDQDFRLTISPGWSVDGPNDRRTIAAPLYFRIESATRRSIGAHLQRLDAVHALLAVCHHSDLKAAIGDVRLPSDPNGEWCDLWERHMMAPGVAAVRQDFPRLRLADLGGVDGVGRWVRLVLAHHRAVDPLIRHTLFGNQSPEARLLSTAAAMEYWVGANARTSSWAKRDGQPIPSVLAKRVSASWNDWVGEPRVWVNRFWNAYLDLKHYRRDRDHDPVEIHALELSGRWLLTAALLDECAGTSGPSEHLFGESLWPVGASVRDELFPSS